MYLATIAPEMPMVALLEEAASFTEYQFDGMVRQGRMHAASGSRLVQRVVARVVQLRGEHVAWVFGLALGSLTGSRMKAGDGAFAMVPLTIFKLKGGKWVPKVVIYLMDEFGVDREALVACHAACRGAGMECMCLTDGHVAEGYVEGKDFKRAFQGAFFCEARENDVIFCPTLRGWGITAWPKGRRVGRAFYQ